MPNRRSPDTVRDVLREVLSRLKKLEVRPSTGGGGGGPHDIDSVTHTGTLDIGDSQLLAPAAGYPVDVASTETDGTSTRPARADHRHAHGSGYAGGHSDYPVVITDHGSLGGLADDDHPQYATDTDLTTHASALDPHTGYQRESEKDQASGYAGLSVGSKVALAQISEVLAIDGLSDVDAQAFATGDILYRASSGKWVRLAIGGLARILRVSATGLPAWVDEEHVQPFSKSGVLAVAVGAMRWYAKGDWTITQVRAAVGTAPTGASLIVDVNKNGTTIFTTQTNRPTIAAGTNTDLADAIEVATLADGDYLTVDVDQIGSGTPGSDLVVEVWMRR
jgi:hypothetical protein